MPMSEETLARAEALIGRYPERRSALLPLLYLVQAADGYVRPVGRYLVSVCRTLPCQLRGSRELSEALCKRLDVPLGGTDATGMVTVEEVECLAACDGAPVVQVNTENYERLSEEQALELVERLLHDEVPPPTLAGDGAVTEPSTAALHWRLSGLGEPPADLAERAATGAGSGGDGDRIGSAPAGGAGDDRTGGERL